jgi:hypothetical protein
MVETAPLLSSTFTPSASSRAKFGCRTDAWGVGAGSGEARTVPIPMARARAINPSRRNNEYRFIVNSLEVSNW